MSNLGTVNDQEFQTSVLDSNADLVRGRILRSI